MGTDYSQGNAINLSVYEIVKIVNGKNKANMVSILHNFCATSDQEAKQKRTKHFGHLTTKSHISDIQNAFIEFCEIAGEPGKYEGDCHFANADSYDIKELINDMINSSGTKCPNVDDVTVFDSYRQHDGCPIGEPCFLLDRSDIYIETLSDQGKYVKKISGGYISEISWTDVSY